MKIDSPHSMLAGRYELLHITGQGGMAVVWRAIRHDEAEQRAVAVKRILLDLAQDPTTVAMFVEEARVGSQLAHPNIVQVLDFGCDDAGGYYLVLEWVEGLDLLEYMRSFHQAVEHLPWTAVVTIAAQALRGLAAAHERVGPDGQPRPVIHRDMSPANILIGMDGVVKIADFGLARAADRLSMTFPNFIKGKLAYTAPEVAMGSPVSVLTDIFGLGVTLWESVAGRRLFPGNTNLDVIRAIDKWEIPPLSTLRPDVPEALHRLCEKAISREPSHRFQSAREMGEAFQELLLQLPERIPPDRLGASIREGLDRLRKMDADIPVSIDETEPMALHSPLPVHFASSPAVRRVGSKRAIPGATYSVDGIDKLPTLPAVSHSPSPPPDPPRFASMSEPPPRKAPRPTLRPPPPALDANEGDPDKGAQH